jgi:hypothetical protein
MDISINGGSPKWMVYITRENPIKMDDLRVPLVWEPPYLVHLFWRVLSSGAILEAATGQIAGKTFPSNRNPPGMAIKMDYENVPLTTYLWPISWISSGKSDMAIEILQEPIHG